MKKQGRSGPAKSRREPCSPGDTGHQMLPLVAKVDTPGILSLALPLLVALAVLAIVLMANVLLGQPAASSGSAVTLALPATTTLEGRIAQ